MLGRLELTRQEELEHRLLTDDEFLEEVLIAEDELIDDFLGNKLSPDDQESFQRFFLSSPNRKEKLKFAKTFKEYVNSTSSPPSLSEREVDQKLSWFQSIILPLRSRKMATAFSLACALLFAVLAGLLFVRERNLKAELERLRAEKSQSIRPLDPQEGKETQRKLAFEAERNTQLEAELKAARQKEEDFKRHIARLETEKRSPGPRTTSGTSFLASVLAMGATRSSDGGLQEIRVPDGYGVINIPLRLPSGEDGRYRATLTFDGKSIHVRGDLPPKEINGQRVVLFDVPAKILTPGEYRIRLSRATGDRKHVGSYDFRIS